MCGIIGFIDANRGKSAATLTTELLGMMNQLRHRGPDDEHTWTNPEHGVALGFRRLAILDLSINGRQPMLSSDERYAIIYNGEVYNFQELQKTLEAKGHRFKGGSDTEVMLASIQEWGLLEATRKFNGMFAFALWDNHKNTLSLVRDRIGIKPLYYGWQGSHFYFGSELKALQQHGGFERTINRTAVSRYVQFGYIPAPFSIYERIYKLPPASILTIDPKKPGHMDEPVEYWRGVPETASNVNLDNAEMLLQLEALLLESVRLRMLSDVPLGAFLSGGIDSSLIVALMQTQSAQPIKTFTIGFHEDNYNEAHHAKRMATAIGTDHTELYLTAEDAMQVIPKLPLIYDEPFADSSQIPTYMVSELTSRHVTVALSGDGGDELFLGYNRYFWAQKIWNVIRLSPRLAKTSVVRMLSSLSVSHWDALAARLGFLLPRQLRYSQLGDKVGKLANILEQNSPASIYHQLVTLWPASLVLGAHDGLGLPDLQLDSSKPNAFIQWMSAMDIKTYLPDDILVKVDRASMAVSLEARAPFLDDHRVVEFAISLPAAQRVQQGQSKWPLRQLLAKYVPQELFQRSKMGFGVPVDDWLRGPLRPWAEDLLSARRLQADGFFDHQLIQNKWGEHLSGQRNWQYHLWVVLMFQAWLDQTARE